MSRAFAAVSVGLVGLVGAFGADGVASVQNRVDLQKANTTVVATRENAKGDLSVLLDVAMNAGRIDELRVNLPSDRKLGVGYVPPGWSVQQDGKRIRAAGPDSASVSIRLDVIDGKAKDYAGRKAGLECIENGSVVVSSDLVMAPLPKVIVSPNIEGILTLPPEITSGQPFLAGTGDAYRRGTWRLTLDGSPAGRIAPLRPVDRLDDELAFPIEAAIYPDFASTPSVQSVRAMFPGGRDAPLVGLIDRAPTRVAYYDQWNELLVDATLDIPIVPPATCQRHLQRGSQFAFAGQAACVAGCFPDVASAYGLTLDGTTKLDPWAVSQSTAMFGIPPDTTAGPHTIQIPGTGTSVTIGVLRLEGSIDQNELWKGQATTMRLKVIGTDQPLPLTVLNRTPSIVTVEGGEYQTVSTPGGGDNAVTRSVRGIMRGSFQITYSLDAQGCGRAPGSR